MGIGIDLVSQYRISSQPRSCGKLAVSRLKNIQNFYIAKIADRRKGWVVTREGRYMYSAAMIATNQLRCRRSLG